MAERWILERIERREYSISLSAHTSGSNVQVLGILLDANASL